MNILIATPEAVPYAKTGGLADVTGSLLMEYNNLGEKANLILPLYSTIEKHFTLKDTGIDITVPLGNSAIKSRIFSHGDSAYFLRCSEFFNRNELYGTPQGDYPDNASRFAFFSRGILEACIALKLKPDVIHCNDWQTGLLPLYLKTIYKKDVFFKNSAALITVHNLGYQGLFPASEMPVTGLDPSLFNPEGIEFYGKLNFLKAGLISSDFITTVSSNYAREILSKEYGFGLDGVLRKRVFALAGIINGIDYKEWNPESDAYIAAHYSAKNISNKMKCKLDILKQCSLNSDTGMPLIGLVSRLSAQKGIDLVTAGIEKILAAGACIVIVGRGDEKYHRQLSDAVRRYKGRLYVKIGFEDELAHKIYAGADIFLMPSRYEPCGLGQMIAMRYGTIPVAKKTGGLADTISEYDLTAENGTGFLFSEHALNALLSCIKTAVSVYADKARWQRLMLNAMNNDFSWNSSAKKYISLYCDVLKHKQAEK